MSQAHAILSVHKRRKLFSQMNGELGAGMVRGELQF